MRARPRDIVRQLLSSYREMETRQETRRVLRCERVAIILGVSHRALMRGLWGGALVTLLLGRSLGVYGLLWVGLGSVAILLILARYTRKRRRALLDRDLPALLTALASSVRAGLDPMASLLSSPQYLPPSTPLVEGIETMSSRLKSGWEEIAAIDGFLTEWRHPDVELFKRCLILSRRHGSALAEPLHRVTRVVRQRQSFRRKTRAALAMHRLSALGIALSGILIGVVQVCMNLEGVRGAIAHPMGAKLLGGGIALIVVGVAWMMSLGTEEAA